MGKYINLKGMKKEDWLFENGLLMPSPASGAKAPEDFKFILDHLYVIKKNIFDEMVLVVLVFNNGFTAAAVCENDKAFMDWADPNDPREKLVFLVNKQRALAEVRDFPL